MEKILMPYFATAVITGERDKAFGAFHADGGVAQIAKNFQIPARATTKI